MTIFSYYWIFWKHVFSICISFQHMDMPKFIYLYLILKIVSQFLQLCKGILESILLYYYLKYYCRFSLVSCSFRGKKKNVMWFLLLSTPTYTWLSLNIKTPLWTILYSLSFLLSKTVSSLNEVHISAALLQQKNVH